MKFKTKWPVLMLFIVLTLMGLTAAAEGGMGHSYGYIEGSSEDLIPLDSGEATIQAEDPYAEIIEQAIPQVREAMKSRQTTMVLILDDVRINEADLGDIALRICQGARAHTGVPNEGDYILRNFSGFKALWESWYIEPEEDIIVEVIYDFSFIYHSDAEMEAQVDIAVDELLKELNLKGKSDYEKVRDIYEWICYNVTYDREHLNDETYTKKYTTYAALIDRTAVCQGYASLFYRLALEEGIDCRFISGRGNGEAHGWNIVKINGKYYNLDATWDSSRAAAERPFEYFLRSNSDFGDHIRDREYATEEFNRIYPMSNSNYNPAVVYVPDDYTINYLDGDISPDGTFYAEIEVTKNSNTEGADVLVIGVYRGGALVDMTYMKSEFEQGQTVVFGGILAAGENCTLRAFVWDSFEDMQVLSNTIEK